MSEDSKLSNVGDRGRSSHGALRGRWRVTDERVSREEGAVLILALAYLVVVSLVVALLSTWVSNDLNNSGKFSSANALTVAASGMTDQAIQYVRYNPLITNSQLTGPQNPSPLVACWGGTSITAIPAIDGNQVAVWCSTVWQPLVAQTRKVTFYACPISVLAAACQGGNALLTAVVTYDDYPPAPARSAPIQDLCTVYCGQGMTIDSWQWGSFATGSVTGVAASMSFTNEPSDTTAMSSTQAAVTVKDSSGNPVAGNSVTLVQQSGPSSSGTPSIPGISAPSSTLTAVTNTSGVATFTNIVPQLAGNYTITAVDGSATATSTNFVVGQQRSVITTSAAPTNATQGGTPYIVSATATTGDVVTITDATTGVCALSGDTVTFKAAGTCTLMFNDPATGNPNYSPALQVTQSFSVGGTTVTQVGITLNTTTPSESTTTNDQVTVTLENAVGATVTSSGTTTVVLSDVASGFFSNTTGTAGTPTLTLTFNNGQSSSSKPAYFGGQTIGPDTITAVNGTTIWGSANLTVVAGTPTQVAITPSPTTPTVSSLTNTTLSLQLEDSGGNFTTAGTSITLTLSAPTGFFATSAGTAGSPTLTVTFPSGVGTATAYIGNQTAGSDVITVKNGPNLWATSTLTFAAGAASQVKISLSSPPYTKGATTNIAVTLQLEDQFGNVVSASGVALTLTTSGSGFFNTKNGASKASSSSSLSLTTNTSGAATGYFGDATTESDTITATGTGLSSTTPPFND